MTINVQDRHHDMPPMGHKPWWHRKLLCNHFTRYHFTLLISGTHHLLARPLHSPLSSLPIISLSSSNQPFSQLLNWRAGCITLIPVCSIMNRQVHRRSSKQSWQSHTSGSFSRISPTYYISLLLPKCNSDL